MSKTNPNDKRIFVGLWLQESSKGTKYLFGSQQDPVTRKKLDPEVKWLIFKDNKDDTVRQLCRTVGSGDMENVVNLKERTSDHGTFHSEGDYLFTENQYYTEGTNQPTHTLIIGKKVKDAPAQTGS